MKTIYDDMGEEHKVKTLEAKKTYYEDIIDNKNEYVPQRYNMRPHRHQQPISRRINNYSTISPNTSLENNKYITISPNFIESNRTNNLKKETCTNIQITPTYNKNDKKVELTKIEHKNRNDRKIEKRSRSVTPKSRSVSPALSNTSNEPQRIPSYNKRQLAELNLIRGSPHIYKQMTIEDIPYTYYVRPTPVIIDSNFQGIQNAVPNIDYLKNTIVNVKPITDKTVLFI